VLPVKWAALGLGLLALSCGLITRNERPSADDDDDGAVAGNGGAAGQARGGHAGQVLTGDGGTEGLSDGGTAGLSDGGVTGAPSPITDPLVGMGAICDGYVSAWRTREAQRDSEETACFACLGYQESCYAFRDAITEGQDACFRRHCLCASTEASCDGLADSCSCFGSCLPDPPSALRQSWLDYMRCEIENCTDACNL
jgi:hypothetical protein